MRARSSPSETSSDNLTRPRVYCYSDISTSHFAVRRYKGNHWSMSQGHRLRPRPPFFFAAFSGEFTQLIVLQKHHSGKLQQLAYHWLAPR